MVCQGRSNRIVKRFSAYFEHPNAESLSGEENTLLFCLNSMKGKMFHLSVETQSCKASQRLTSGWQGHCFVPNPNERNFSRQGRRQAGSPCLLHLQPCWGVCGRRREGVGPGSGVGLFSLSSFVSSGFKEFTPERPVTLGCGP